MKALVQKALNASVEVDGKIVGKIDSGLLIFFGTTHSDTVEKLPFMVDKIINLRIFPDNNGKMNLSLLDAKHPNAKHPNVKQNLLVVSQFTLYGDVAKGRRPSFINAQKPDIAKEIYDKFIELLKEKVDIVQTGIFGAKMQVHLTNDGPLTFMVEN